MILASFFFNDKQNLRVAWLTHSFHCCAFQFPSRHDPKRHARRLKYLSELQKSCMSGKHNIPTTEIDHTTVTPNVSEYVRVGWKLIVTPSSPLKLHSVVNDRNIRFVISE